MRSTFLISSLALTLAACTTGSATAPSARGPATGAKHTPVAGSPESPVASPHACQLTAPGGPRPPDGLPPKPYVGNGQLWVGLWQGGLVVVPADNIGPDGSMRAKFMWWRGPGVRGVLDISGSGLGSSAGSVHGQTAGYGVTGFNASSIYFPGEGCYRVTGTAGGATLSFVTRVRTCSVLDELAPTLRRDYAAFCRNG